MEIYRDHRMGPKCYAAQCIVNREENLQNCLFSLVLRHSAGGGPSHGDRQHAQTFGKDRACGSGDMLTDRQTDTHTHTDVLITILRPGFRGQKGKGNEGIFTTLFILCMYISKRSDMDHTVLPANYTIPCDFCICVFRYSYLINYLYHHHHHHHQVIYSAPTINVSRRCITMSNIKIVKNK